MGNEYIHVVINLFAVIVLMLVLLFIVKKFKLSKFGGNKYINIINVVSVGPKEKIILLEINKSYLLLGSTPNHIETLHIFAELDPITPTLNKAISPKNTFSELMTKITN